MLKKGNGILALMLMFSVSLKAQKEDTAYTRVIYERAGKIVKTLQLNNNSKEAKLQSLVADQYRQLNGIHEGSKLVASSIKQNSTLSKGAKDTAILKEDEKKMALLKQQHEKFITLLKKEVGDTEIEKIKDGMTYSVMPITYKAYNDMLPMLTEVQRKKIYDYLVEAREFAMDAESSDKKHWWFGKYKGRINNYLSAEGIDTKKAREEWEAKLKANQTNSSKND